MPPIPIPTSTTLGAIMSAIAASRDDYESVGISAGDIGTECERELWYKFRRAGKPEEIDWRKARIFERGNIEEERLLALLTAIGCTVTEQQARARDCGGHLRGKIDGQVIGLPEAPKAEHVVECKSSKADKFREMKKNGLRRANPKHYATLQFYMHKRGLDRALYMMSCKDTEDLHIERVYYNAEFALQLIAKCTRVIQATKPPARLCGKRDDFRGVLCKYKEICWQEIWARSHCRTCIHSTPELFGDAAWSCDRWAKPLGLAEQEAGCAAHLYLPDLVPGVQTDYDAESETVTYTLNDGSVWVDGRDRIRDG